MHRFASTTCAWRRCTSLSRLERAFREVFGVSPHRLLMLRRLAAVRRELLRADAGTSVTDVATRWGFFHLGRFSQEYRLMYGERPSQTLSARGVLRHLGRAPAPPVRATTGALGKPSASI